MKTLCFSNLSSKMSFNGISTGPCYAVRTILYLSLCLFFYISMIVDAYDPVDRFSINCGSIGNSSNGDRTWTGDINSKLLTLEDKQTVAAQATTQSASTNQVPYTTARLSNSEFSYSFPVTTGPKFVRLFFYPASYNPNFDRPNALFTVKSGGYTLLKDFNASLNSDADHADTIFREYIINVDDGQRLNLTFTPNNSQPNSYAFVNGIEVVSMPTDLYYTEPSGQQLKLVGSNTQYSIGNNTALETKYRLKVGGNTITAKNDAGLLSRWDGDDDNYLKTPTAKNSLPGDMWGTMNITVTPDYIAPKEIYRTARSMGPNATINKRVNLTWEFPVDAGFTYLLRLHFCELEPNIAPGRNRAFFIYIAQQVAEDHADVLAWSREKGVAVHRDYAVIIPDLGNQKNTTLSLQMHPLPGSQTFFSDAFLNGLEIFKISDGQNNLAGPNSDPVPVPHTPVTRPNSVQNSKSSNGKTVTRVVAGVVPGVVLLSAIAVFVLIRRLKKKKASNSKFTTTRDPASKWSPISTTNPTIALSSSLPFDLCRHFSLHEIIAATKNFHVIIGFGGFGNVYLGYINGGMTPVAIKRLKPGSQQGFHEFMTEIEMLSQLRHRHLVSLIGYCKESNEMILVYDFMARGTLRDHLYNTNNPPLPWKQRLQICIGAARGLHYLHAGAMHNIIHRDVKTTNILLDEKWVAKISDFGLSRIGPSGISRTHVNTGVKGSIGYMDPEYYERDRLTEKSDVYSFGVVLFEVLCARPPVISALDNKQASLARWGRHCRESGTLDQIVDPALKGKIAPECLRKYGEIAVSCLLDDGTQRPSMNDVVRMLESALQLQESAEQGETSTSGKEQYSYSSEGSGRNVSIRIGEEHCHGNKEIEMSIRSETVSSEN